SRVAELRLTVAVGVRISSLRVGASDGERDVDCAKRVLRSVSDTGYDAGPGVECLRRRRWEEADRAPGHARKGDTAGVTIAVNRSESVGEHAEGYARDQPMSAR